MSRKFTTEEFKEQVRLLGKGEYELDPSSEYLRNDIKVKMIHKTCGNTYEVTPAVFKHGRRCPYCNGGVKSNIDDFKKFVKDTVGDEYMVVGEYVNGHTPIKLIHNTNSPHEYMVTPTWFKAGSRCPLCQGLKKRTQDEFIKEVYDKVGDEYTVLGIYTNNKTKVKFKHNKCNREFEMIPKDFLNHGFRCPLCKTSRGELKICEVLDHYGVEYTQRYKIPECKNRYILEFDFMVPYDDGTFCLIEYDGRLHYEPWKNNQASKDHLKHQQDNDKVKNQYCKDNNITLIRIPYWDYEKIESILCEKLNLLE